MSRQRQFGTWLFFYLLSTFTHAQNGQETLRQYSQGQFVPYPRVAQVIQSNADQSLPIVLEILTRGTAEQQTLLLTTLETTNVSCSSLNSNLSSLLHSPAWTVRAAALKLIRLKKCGIQSELVRQLLARESDLRVAGMAASALTVIGNFDDGLIIQASLNCPEGDKACRIQRESALRKLGYPYKQDVLIEAFRSSDEPIQRLALQCFEDDADQEIATIIDSQKNFPLGIQYYRDYTVERMKINALPSVAQKEEALWQSLEKRNPILSQWAAETLLIEHQSSATQTRLKNSFLNSLNQLAGPPEHKLSEIRTKSEGALMNILINRGIMSQDEIVQKIQPVSK